jgi:dihydrofolate reductase
MSSGPLGGSSELPRGEGWYGTGRPYKPRRTSSVTATFATGQQTTESGTDVEGREVAPTFREKTTDGGSEMRDLVVTENITVDGVIEATEGWFNPGDADLSDVMEVVKEQREAADAFLVGRQTFEDMRGYWPHQTDDPTGISDYLNAVAKYVVSSTLDDPQWDHSTVLRGLGKVESLKAQAGKDIVTTGSIKLVHSLMKAGLVDEYRLFVYPVVLGRGQRLFHDGITGTTLRLTEAQPFSSGVTLLRYRTT